MLAEIEENSTEVLQADPPLAVLTSEKQQEESPAAVAAAPTNFLYGQPTTLLRYSTDGHVCLKTWDATWSNGAHLRCHTYCCYYTNVYGRRTPNSYCRVLEYGRYALKPCAGGYTSLAEAGKGDEDAVSSEAENSMNMAMVGLAAAVAGALTVLLALAYFGKRATVRTQPLLA